MADMADIDSVEEAWEALAAVTDIDRVVPVTYMNSSAALKAFVGRHGGVVCTSSNARAVLTWALGRTATAGRRGDQVLFFPDQHLGRNTGYELGYGGRRHGRVESPPRPGRAGRRHPQVGHPAAVEGALLGPPAVPSRPHRRLPGRAPRRHRGRPPRVRPRRGGGRRPGRLDRLHHPGGGRGPGRVGDRGGDRDPPGQAARRRDPRQDGGLPRPAGVPVLDHVPDRRRPSGLGARGPGRG